MGALETESFLQQLALAGLQARHQPGQRLLQSVPELSLTCAAMADRFARGGRLLAFGLGLSSIDAAHVAVEFVHPVVVGKRALPAISVAPDPTVSPDQAFASAIGRLGRPQDIAMGLFLETAPPAVVHGLATGRAKGLLTVALGVEAARLLPVDHMLGVPSGEALIARELQITLYHILWELVHIFLDQTGPVA